MVLNLDILEQLFYSCSSRLVTYAGRMLQDSDMANDLVQDIFVRFWEKYKGTDSDHWEGVLYTMTRNRCLDQLKHLQVQHRLLGREITETEFEKLIIEDLTGTLSVTDDKLLVRELNRELEAIIASMPDKCREVFTLSRQEGLGNEEIARRLGISVKAVEKHITKALRILRSRLTK